MTSTADNPSVSGDASTAAPNRAATLARLRAVVLLAGTVRPTGLTAAIGRSMLDLPIARDATLFQHWVGLVHDLAQTANLTQLPLRILLDPTSPAPQAPMASGPVVFQVERDPLEYRGVGGVLHDVTLAYAEDDYILVGNAAHLLLESLPAMVQRLADAQADVSMLAQPDASPTGLMLIRVRSLREIAEIGFVDLKEQALPTVARKHRVMVVKHAVNSHSVRSATGYIRALRQYHLRQANVQAAPDPFAEDWHPTFRLVEDAARVDPSATVHDSVVLGGALIGPNAMIARSVVCPGARVAPGATVVDQLVTA